MQRMSTMFAEARGGHHNPCNQPEMAFFFKADFFLKFFKFYKSQNACGRQGGPWPRARALPSPAKAYRPNH